MPTFAPSRAPFAAFALSLVLGLALLSARALAQPVVGVGPNALPAVVHVPLATPSADGLAYAGTLGYGYTEAVENASDTHHRLGVRLAGSYTLAPALALGASFGGHYDAHRGGSGHGEASFIAGTRVLGRTRAAISEKLSLGAELALNLPGADSFQLGLKAISPELRGLATWTQLAPGLTLGASLGFRLDRSAQGIRNAAQLSAAQRIGVDASDSSALLLGVGASHALSNQLHLLGELSWDAQVGPNAPSALASPLRVQGGVRYFTSETLQLEALAGVSPSTRPNPSATDPLTHIEPRVWFSAGIGGTFASTPSTVALRGRVVDERGQPLSGVRIFGRMPSDDDARSPQRARDARDELARTDRDGRYSVQWPRATRVELSASAEHFVDGEQQAAPSAKDLELQTLVLRRGRGSLRGRVLDPRGVPLASAIVTVWPSALDARDGRSATPEPYPPVAVAPDGSFVMPELSSGPVEIEASSVGLRDGRASSVVPVGGEAVVDVRLEPALPEGQIRLTVRGARGAALTVAQVRIEPLGQVLTVNEQGTLSVDVTPGSYTLLVTAAGYEPQQRKAEVEQDGVTVLLVDLQRQP